MEAAGKGDDGVAAGGGAGDLDGVLERLGAGRHEDRLLFERAGNQRVQPLGERDVVLVGHHLVAGVGEALELILDGLDHLRVAVAGVEHRDAGSEVDVAAAFDIPDLGILGAVGENLRLDTDAAGDGALAALFHCCV